MTKKAIITTTLVVAILLFLGIDSIANALVGFMLAGVIPGTTVVVPFWAMVGLWCLVITAITTLHIEATVAFMRTQQSQKDRSDHPQRRRYTRRTNLVRSA